MIKCDESEICDFSIARKILPSEYQEYLKNKVCKHNIHTLISGKCFKETTALAYKLDVKYAQFKKLDVVDQIKKLKPVYMKVADKLEDMEFSEIYDDGF